MAVTKLSTSGLISFARYNSMLAGYIAPALTVDYLVIAGGGGGGATGSGVDYNCGAGGAGGYRSITSDIASEGNRSIVFALCWSPF